MTKAKKAPAGVAAPTEANERELRCSISQSDYTAFSGVRQPSAYLSRGQENAIAARELARLMGFSGTRPLRLAVERERRAGALILICERGYFLPSLDAATAEQEIRRYVRLMDARVRSNRAAVQSCKAYLHRCKRREALFDEQ